MRSVACVANSSVMDDRGLACWPLRPNDCGWLLGAFFRVYAKQTRRAKRRSPANNIRCEGRKFNRTPSPSDYDSTVGMVLCVETCA